MHFVNAKGILSSGNGMNLYRGCTHGCIYCDSRSLCYQFTHDFEDIEVKQNAPELLEKALKSKRKKCMIGTGAMSDPYMHCEENLRLTRRCLEIILEKYEGPALSQADKEALAAKKNDIYRESLARMSPADLSAEVRETLEALRAKGLKLAIGSSSKNAPFILERLGLGNFFDAVSDGNCITRSKPDPEVFLKAAEFLGLAPEACVVVEDAVSGAQAGRAGGFAVACVGDACAAGTGDWNLSAFSELLERV